MSDTMETLPVEWVRPSRLHDLERGQLFVPFEDQGLYLAGSIGSTPALICLRYPAFEASGRDRWARMRGYVIDAVRFEVDRTTAKQVYADSDLEKGQLVRFTGGLGLCGVERTSKWIVELNEPDSGEGRLADMVAFGRWMIVAGEGNEKRALFTNIGNEVVDGPFDPDVDQLA